MVEPGSPAKAPSAAFFAGLLVTLVFCGAVLHRFVFFRRVDSSAVVVLLFVLWLSFRIAYPRLADPRRVGQGFLVGLELFLLLELAVNTCFLRRLDPESFATAFYLSAGIFLLLDRLRMMFPSVKARWPLSLPAYGMAALLLFGSVSSTLLIESTCKKVAPDQCASRRSQALLPEDPLFAPAGQCAFLPVRGLGAGAREVL